MRKCYRVSRGQLMGVDLKISSGGVSKLLVLPMWGEFEPQATFETQ